MAHGDGEQASRGALTPDTHQLSGVSLSFNGRRFASQPASSIRIRLARHAGERDIHARIGCPHVAFFVAARATAEVDSRASKSSKAA